MKTKYILFIHTAVEVALMSLANGRFVFEKHALKRFLSMVGGELVPVLHLICRLTTVNGQLRIAFTLHSSACSLPSYTFMGVYLGLLLPFLFSVGSISPSRGVCFFGFYEQKMIFVFDFLGLNTLLCHNKPPFVLICHQIFGVCWEGFYF